MKSRVYDCFSFFNENDLLEIRLNILKDYVDKFVIVEATKTHSGFDKPLYFDKERFKEFENKIIYYVPDKYPEFKTSWTYENYQRNCIMDILKNECNDDDIIIISDLDEIISPKAIEKYKKTGKGVTSIEQKFYYCYLNMINSTTPKWDFAKILRYKDFYNQENDIKNYSEYLLEELNQEITPTKIRMMGTAVKNKLKNGGWHFSYLGGIDKIIEKLKSFSHQEFNREEIVNREFLLKQIENGNDILGRDFKYEFVPVDLSYPKYIRNNKKKLSNLIYRFSPKLFIKYILPKFTITKNSNVIIYRMKLLNFNTRIKIKLKENK